MAGPSKEPSGTRCTTPQGWAAPQLQWWQVPLLLVLPQACFQIHNLAPSLRLLLIPFNSSVKQFCSLKPTEINMGKIKYTDLLQS